MEKPVLPVLDRTAYLIEHAYSPPDRGQMRLPPGTGAVLLIIRCDLPPAPGCNAVIAQL